MNRKRRAEPGEPEPKTGSGMKMTLSAGIGRFMKACGSAMER